MIVYEKNLKKLGKQYPDMDNLIQKAKESGTEEIEIIEEESLEGERILKVNKDGRTCYLNGKRNTKEPAQMWVKSQKTLFPDAPVFMMGVGNWSYLEELVKQTKNRIVIFVYEPSLKIFLYFLEHVDITHWMEKHLIVFWVKGIEGMDTEHMGFVLERLLNYETLNLSRYLIVPNYNVLFLEETREFVRKCRNIVTQEMVQKNTKERFAAVLAKNLLFNIRYLLDGYSTLQLSNMVPNNMPAILVAAGPSLNKNIHELRRAKGKAFIIAVDTAIKPLLNAGIVPDMFVIVDGKKPLELVKIDGADQIPLMPTIEAASEVLSYHKGMKFFYTEGFKLVDTILFRYCPAESLVPSGGSVATSAFGFLYRIGVKTVILVGQDLALTNNRSHADGTFQEKMEEVDTSRFMMVKGNCEKEVPTRGDFKAYLEWYEMYIEGCLKERPDFRVINATEGGAMIKHTEVMTLKEAIDRECCEEKNFQEFFAGLKPMFHTEEDRKWVKDYLDSIPEKCNLLQADARKIIKLYQKLDKICNRGNIDKKEYLNLLKKLDKQIKKIEPQAVYDLVQDVMSEAHYILKNEQFMEYGTLQEEGKEVARKGTLYMELVAECAAIFREYLDDLKKDTDEKLTK